MLPGQHQEVKMPVEADWSPAVVEDFGVSDLRPQTRAAKAPLGRRPAGS